MSKTEAVVKEFSDKIEQNEAKYWIAPSYLRLRSHSFDYTVDPYFNFEEDPEIFEPVAHPLKKSKLKVLRVHSQPRTQA